MHWRIAASVSLAVLAILPFLGGAGGGFIGDDVPIIKLHSGLREGGNAFGAFAETYWRDYGAGGLYRPLTVSSFALDRVVWGAGPSGAPSPEGIHRTNLILNAIAVLLVFAVLRRRLPDLPSVWIGAALFATHPVHTEAVLHLVGRADLLMTIFFLAAFQLHRRPGWKARFGAPACALAAVLSKEMAIVLPAVLLLDAALMRPAGSARAWLSRELRELAPLFGVGVAYLGVRGLVLGASLDPPSGWVLAVPGRMLAFADAGPVEVGLTMLHAFGESLLLLVAPLWLSADYSGFPHSTTLGLPVLVSALAWVGLLAGVAWAWRRGEREPALWTGFFALTMLPVSNLLVTSGVILAERVLYLPSLSVCAIAAWGMSRLRRRHSGWISLFAVWLAAFTVQSSLRSPVWSDSRTLYEETVEHGRHRGHVALNGLVGVYRAELRDHPDPELHAKARAYAREAVEAFDSFDNVANYSTLIIEDGDFEESLRVWRILLRRRPDHALYRRTVRSHLEMLVARARQEADEEATRRWQREFEAFESGRY